MNVKDLEEISFLKISNWWGLGNAGFAGYAVLEDGQIIKYNSTHNRETNLQEEKVDVMCKLSQEDVAEFKKYLLNDEKILETTYEQPMIFDMGTTVKIKIDGQTKEIKNESKLYKEDEEKLYDRIINKIEGLISKN